MLIYAWSVVYCLSFVVRRVLVVVGWLRLSVVVFRLLFVVCCLLVGLVVVVCPALFRCLRFLVVCWFVVCSVFCGVACCVLFVV